MKKLLALIAFAATGYSQSSLAHFERGQAFLESNDPVQAANEYREALAGDLQPKWIAAVAHIKLGQIFEGSNQHDRAANEYRHAAMLPVSDRCVTTVPSSPPFVPPPPFWPTAPEHMFWFGSADLWTQLSNQGEWGSTQKVPLWSAGYDPRIEPQPDIVMVGIRLDGEPTGFATRGGSNMYFNTNIPAMLTLVKTPAPGCGEISAYYKEHVLSFVVLITE